MKCRNYGLDIAVNDAQTVEKSDPFEHPSRHSVDNAGIAEYLWIIQSHPQRSHFAKLRLDEEKLCGVHLR